MSHKTGKRVLTASTTLALAVVGLAASPLTAHAATPGAQLVNACGGPNDAAVTHGIDYVVFPAESGTYSVFDQGNATTPTVVNTSATATTSMTDIEPDAAGMNVLDGDAVGLAEFSADGKSVKYFIKDTAYGSADSAGVRHSLTSFAVYSSGTQLLGSGSAFDDATCAVQAIPTPVAKLAASPANSGGTITVTKGTGLAWTIDDGSGAAVNAKVSNAATVLASDNKTIVFPAGSGADATVVLQISDGTAVTVTATPAAGYTGVAKSFEFKLDDLTQVNYVAPTKQDRDGIESDTVTLQNIPGVTWFFSTADTAPVSDPTMLNANGWEQITFQSGEKQATITRPSTNTTGVISVRAVISDALKYKWDAGGDQVTKNADQGTFGDKTIIKALPAPEMVDGPGADDYFVLPKVDGVKWVVGPTGGGNDVTYTSANPLVGTRIPVYTYGQTAPVEYTFSAVIEDAAKYDWDPAVTTKQWKHEFDSRAAITPAAPQFIDMTGIFDDAITFPALQPGLSGYKIGLSAASAADAKTSATAYVGGGWYGQTVKLTELQRTFAGGNINAVYVDVEAVVNDQLYTLAEDADGNTVKAAWPYKFTNSVNIVPQAPTQAPVDGDPSAYTLTFPVDPRVTYSTVSGGITRTIPFSDLGKALRYTGQVTVRAAAATGYTLQPKSDGSAPDPWVFVAPNTIVTPKAPTPVDKNGTADDTITLWATTGIEWYVNGTRMDPAGYDKPQSTLGQNDLKIQAKVLDGYVLADGAQTQWEFPYKDVVDVPPTNPVVDKDITSSEPPTAKFTWGADNATSYDVTYHKKLINGSAGPEIDWLMDTTETSADFIAEHGDEYTITVVAKNAHGSAEGVSSTVTFPGGTEIGDVTTGQGTFSAGWNLLGKSQLSGLPYFGDTAALASNGATWTYTVPAGTKSFDLFATVHSLGAKGKIWVNGVNWANFETNPSYWGTVSNPYGYPVRRVQGWDNTKSATITVQQTEGGNLYLALDAYRVNK